MSFIFMVLHYPTPAHRDELARAMNERRDLLASTSGCIQVDPAYVTADGEPRPRVRFFLHEAPLPVDSAATGTQ